MKIELRIGRLVLEGFASGERRAVGQGLERELARRLEAGGLPAGLERLGARARIEAGDCRVEPGAPPAEVGRALAASVYRGLAR